MRTLTYSERIRIHSCLSEGGERRLADDVLDGLTRPFKEIPPKHFYDARGSELFEQICELPEYYPTRTERQILEERAPEIAQETGAVELVELGSGSAEKARILLDAMAEEGALRRYVPLDVSEHALRQAATELVGEYDELEVDGIVADFERHLDSVPDPDGGPRIVALLGGTIGNFPPGTRRRLLRGIRRLLGPEDRLLMGTDLVKDPAILEAAYDDSAGITAEFNRNVLHVINRELDADFAPDEFEHVAFFDTEHEWIEMRLRATHAQSVEIAGLGMRVEFESGEELRTEISAKFTRQRVESDLEAAELELERWYTDQDGLFALSLAAPAPDDERRAVRLYGVLVRAGYPLRRWVRLELAGRELLPDEGPVIVVSNHDSQMDPPSLVAACYPRREIRFLAKAELWKGRVYGFVLNRLDQIPLERGGGGLEALGRAVEALDRGEAVGIFPEGGLSRGRARRAGRGVAELIRARPEVPVVLAAVTGAGDVVRFPKRPRILVQLIKPDPCSLDGSALAQRLMDQIRAVAPPVVAGRAGES